MKKQNPILRSILILGIALLLIPFGKSTAQSDSCNLEAIVADVGKLSSSDASVQPQVILIQERHDLVTSQIESAIMIL